MSSIDPNIPLMYRPPQVDIASPVDTMAKSLTLRHLVNQGQLGEMQLDEAKRQQAEDEAVRKVFLGYNPDKPEDTLNALYGVAPARALTYQKSMQEMHDHAVTTQKNEAELHGTKMRQLASIAGTMTDPQSYMLGIHDALSRGLIDKNEAQVYLDAGWGPETQGRIRQIQQQALEAAAQMDEIRKQAGEKRAVSGEDRAVAAEKRAVEKWDVEKGGLQADAFFKQANQAERTMPTDQASWSTWRAGLPETLQARVPAMFSPQAMDFVRNMSMTAKERADLAAGKASRDEAHRHNVVGEANADTAPELTPAAEEMVGNLFKQTGYMPGLGQGKSGSKLRTQVINKAAAGGPVNIAMNKADYEASKKSLVAIQGNLDAVTAFEGTAKANLDRAIGALSKLVDLKSPLINKAWRTIDYNLLGNDDIPAYEAARRVAVNEVAKVTSNPTLAGALSDSSRHEVESFIPEEATLGGILKVAKVLRGDMDARKAFYTKQLKEVRARMQAGYAGAAAPDAATEAPGGGGPAAGGRPPLESFERR